MHGLPEIPMEVHSASIEIDGKLDLVNLAFGDDKLELRAGSTVIDSWPFTACRLEKVDGDQYMLKAGDEELLLRPKEPGRFATTVTKVWPRQTLAEKIVAVRGAHVSPAEVPTNDTPLVDSGQWWKVPRNKVILAVSLLLAAVVFASAFRQPSGVTYTTIVTTAPPVAGLSPDSAFSLTQAGLVSRWNQLATDFDAPLRIADEADDLEFDYRVNSRIRLTGRIDPSSRLVQQLILVAEPTGKGKQDLQLVASWGILIAATDPSLADFERRRLMSKLGVDVEAPALLDDTTEVVERGVRYRLASNSQLGLVLLEVEPVEVN